MRASSHASVSRDGVSRGQGGVRADDDQRGSSDLIADAVHCREVCPVVCLNLLRSIVDTADYAFGLTSPLPSLQSP